MVAGMTEARLVDIWNPAIGEFQAHSVTEPAPVLRERLNATMIAVAAAEYARLWLLGSWLEANTSMGMVDTETVLAAAKLASDQPGSSVMRPFAGGRLVVLFTPGDATADPDPGDAVPPVRLEDTLGFRASEVLAFAKELSVGLTDADVIQAIEAHPNVHDCTVRRSDSGERFFAFRVKPSGPGRAAGDGYKRTRYEFAGASMKAVE